MHTAFWRLILALFLCLTSASQGLVALAADHELLRPRGASQPLRPFLDFYIDESLSMDIEEAAAPALDTAWQPLAIKPLPDAEGITWLRFTLAPIPPRERQGTYLLDMGESVPGTPVLYDPVRNELSDTQEWRENTPAQRNILLLPEQAEQPLTCYIRIDGLPGPWFYPMIRTPQDAAANWSGLSRTGALLTLAVVMLLCLLRWASESGQWRVWTSLFVAVALAQGILGMPPLLASFSFVSLASVLAPGIALMLLPHVGRHLMRTPQTSRAIDIQLSLLSLPGAVLALLPLVPGWTWLDRWSALWPGCLVLFIPTALGAWIMGLPGSRRFLLGCIIPPLLVGFALVGLDFGLAPNILASLPLWGIALSALLIAATKTPGYPGSPENNKATPPGDGPDSVINLDHPLDDPNLRLISAEICAKLPTAAHASTDAPVQLSADARALEEKLRVPLDSLLRDVAALGHCSLPPAVRQYAENLLADASQIGAIICGAAPSQGLDSGLNPEVQPAASTFSLQTLLRDAHDSVSSLAENAGVSLSWFLPPQLVSPYRGNLPALRKVLELLLESAVRASPGGVVRLTVRKLPESDDPGRLLFTIADNGQGAPPIDRSPLALARAWELASSSQGYFGVEATPQGVTVLLAVHLEPVAESHKATASNTAHIIIAGPDTAASKHLAAMLDSVPARITLASSSREVLAAQGADPSPLLIAHGDLAMPSSADMAHHFALLAHEAGFCRCAILAVTQDDSQWKRLKPSGFTHAMLEPDDPDSFMQTVRELLGENLPGQQPESGEETPEGSDAAEATPTEPQAADVLDDTPRIIDYQPNLEHELADILDDTVTDIEESARLEDIAQEPASQGAPGETGQRPTDAESALPKPASSSIADNEPVLAEAGGAARRLDRVDFQEEFVEWVGEPTPIAQPRQTPPKTAQKQDNNFDEWVGEPIPVIQLPHPSGTGAPSPVAPQPNPAPVPAAKVPGTGDSAENPDNKAVEPAAPLAADSSLGTSDSSGDFALASDDTLPHFDDDPEVTALLDKLDKAMNTADQAYHNRDCMAIAQSTSAIVEASKNFGLHWLERMSACVQRAAEAGDMDALADLLPELSSAVERNRIALAPKK